MRYYSKHIMNLWGNILQEGGTVMKSTVVNTSKEMMAYSDFPPPAHYPNFAHHSLIMEYLREYAKKFDLCQYIKFNTNVDEVILRFCSLRKNFFEL